jgi:hypothetical protein
VAAMLQGMTQRTRDLDQEVSTVYDCHCISFVVGSLEIQFMVTLQEDRKVINKEWQRYLINKVTNNLATFHGPVLYLNQCVRYFILLPSSGKKKVEQVTFSKADKKPTQLGSFKRSIPFVWTHLPTPGNGN